MSAFNPRFADSEFDAKASSEDSDRIFSWRIARIKDTLKSKGQLRVRSCLESMEDFSHDLVAQAGRSRLADANGRASEIVRAA